jgi:hypothetical protein
MITRFILVLCLLVCLPLAEAVACIMPQAGARPCAQHMQEVSNGHPGTVQGDTARICRSVAECFDLNTLVNKPDTAWLVQDAPRDYSPILVGATPVVGYAKLYLRTLHKPDPPGYQDVHRFKQILAITGRFLV